MKKLFFLTLIFFTIHKKININKSIDYYKNDLLNGVYKIGCCSNNLYFKIKDNVIQLLSDHTNFRIVLIKSNEYFIEPIFNNKKLGINKNGNIKFYNKTENKNLEKTIWNIIKIKENQFLIYNKYNLNLMEARKDKVIYRKKYNSEILTEINNNFLFCFLKLYEETNNQNKYIQIIKKEPIDIIIKYIDLTDKKLDRLGIKQMYKDQDNEELRFSIRSILIYMPWIRKIHILMPNNKVRFFKPSEEIKYKINYINDKDFLGFDSANIFAFTFNLHKLEKFGVTKNFIYMEDDFFIGKNLKKSDFFYFDDKEQIVKPFILNRYFDVINKTEIIYNYNNLYKIKDSIFPHSRDGWWLSIYCTNKYFIDHYNISLINSLFTHNAISENIDDLKEIYKEIQNYEYINETLFSKERFILTLNQPQFFILYQLNIKHRKVNPIKYEYIEMELIKRKALNIPLFVINTGGNHKPLKRQYKIQKIKMEKRFKYKTLFEANNNLDMINNYKLKINYIYFLKAFIIITLIKLSISNF